MSERHFRRLRDRYEVEGAEGIIDRRRGRVSGRRAAADKIEWVIEQFSTRYYDFTVKHFHEELAARRSCAPGRLIAKEQKGRIASSKPAGRMNPRLPVAFMPERRRPMSKRELIDTGTDKRYVRREDQGQFKESVDVGRSLAQDVRQHAKTKAKPGEGDHGDR